MGLGRTELCMLAVILACVAYLYLESNDESFTKPRMAAAEDFALSDSLDEESAVHSIRSQCTSTGTAGNTFLLDLTYPQSLTPNETKELGNTILGDLFDKSSCPNGGLCYQWTLVINKGEYVRTRTGSSAQKQPCKMNPVPVTPEIMDATIGTIYIKDLGNDDKQTLYKCTLETVYCVLMDDLHQYNDTYVETVLANELVIDSRY